MPIISEQEINQVRNKADIVEIIGHYLPVSKKGKSYVALCPFHDDHSPSMSISPDKQIYKCFVCGAGGNVFTFVQNYENVSFPEAVKEVADLVGITLSYDYQDTVVKDPVKENRYKLLNETINYAMYTLNSEDCKNEREYLEKRGIDKNVRDYFEIGYLPSGDKLYKFLNAKGFKDKDMVDVNVARTSSSGMHDVFSSRITFPVHDSQGHPIGFSARTLNNNESKYINTNDTDLFKKGELVYNLHRAKNSARKEGKIYVCEGVTDVIAFYRAGIQNCVCTLGTACTEKQLRLLKSTALKIVFCYDGDDAGQNATWKAAKLAQKVGCQVGIIKNDTGLDPDEIVSKHGAEGLKELLKNEQIWMEFALDYLQKHSNLNNYSDKKEFVQKAMAEVELLNDEFDKQHFTNEISKISGMPIVYEKERKKFNYETNDKHLSSNTQGSEAAEEIILAQMLAHPEAIQHFSDKLGYLTNPVYNSIAMLVIDKYRKYNNIDISALIDSVDDDKIKKKISDLATFWAYELPYDEKQMDGAIRKVHISINEAQLEAYKEQLQQPMNAESREVLLNKYQECLLTLRRYINEENSK